MDPKALAEAVEEDKRNGIVPFCVVATVGTTSTSSIDPVPAIVEVCEKHTLWLHVDTAYAGSAAVVPELRYLVAGCERADSVVTSNRSTASTFSARCAEILRTREQRRKLDAVEKILWTTPNQRVHNHDEIAQLRHDRGRASVSGIDMQPKRVLLADFHNRRHRIDA